MGKNEIWTDDRILKIIVTQIINHCRIIRTLNPTSPQTQIGLKTKTAKEIVQQLIPSIQQLLPTFPYLQ